MNTEPQRWGERGKAPTRRGLLSWYAAKGRVRAVYTPADAELQGRAIALWLEHRGVALSAASVYCTVEIRDTVTRRTSDKLWQWIQETIAKVPRATTLVICTDANGHVGGLRRYDAGFTDMRAVYDVAGGGARTGDLQGELGERGYPHIGPMNPEKENFNGGLLRKFCETCDLVATNTWTTQQTGVTWKGGKNAAHRVDYVLVDRLTWIEGEVRFGDGMHMKQIFEV